MTEPAATSNNNASTTPGAHQFPAEFVELTQLVDFLREVDQLKSVARRTWLLDHSRRENSAEHSWHIALMALVLAPYANEPVAIDRVVRMLLVHDLVEIYAGDTFAYDRVGRQEASLREDEAAEKLFGTLPDATKQQMWGLWREFEDQTTPEARFAKAMDRFMPLLHNFYTEGSTWREYGITLDQVMELNRRIDAGSTTLWRFVEEMLRQAVAAGYLAPGQAPTPTPTPTPTPSSRSAG